MKTRVFLFSFLFFCLSLAGQSTEPLPILRIGGDQNYPPFEFINSEGLADGYNVELSRLVCAEIGYTPAFRLGKWSLVRNWLEDGSIDLIQGMAYSSERAHDLLFSNPHARTWRGVFKQKKSPVKGLGKDPSLVVAVQEDDIAEDYLRQIGFEGKLSRLANQEEALKLLNDGVYDAAVANYMMGMYIIKRDGLKNIKSLPQRIYQRDYCYAAHNAELILQINAAIAHLEANGDLQKLRSKWFSSLDNGEQDIEKLFSLAPHSVAIVIMVFAIVLALFIYYVLTLRRKQKELDYVRNQLSHRQFLAVVFKDLFETGRVIVFSLDYRNRRLLDITSGVMDWGYSPNELLEHTSEIVYGEDIPRYRLYYESLNDKAHSLAQYRILTKSGDLRWVLDYAKLYIRDTDGMKIVMGYLIDITDLKSREIQLYNAREKAESEANAKGHLCAVMSHEIRNAMSGSFGFIQILRQMNKDADLAELLDYLYTAELNSIKMLDNVLDYSKIDAGKVDLIYSNFDLKREIAQIVQNHELQMVHKELKIEYQISENLPQIIFGDLLRLRQILSNLLQNALKFTEEGKVEIAAEPYTISENEIRILFKVKDSGIGIQNDKLKDIFENFHQAEETIGLKYGGSGLGLAIVKRLVELMQGFIWVESEPQAGSCFYFILPFALKANKDAEDFVVQVPQIKRRAGLKGRVLLAEDQAMNRLFAMRLLEMFGLKVDVAMDANQAIAMHKEKLYDLLLIDMQLPVMGGLGFAAEIRKLETVLSRRTPIIVASERDSETEMALIKTAGIDECIQKPMDIDLIYEIISKYLPQAD